LRRLVVNLSKLDKFKDFDTALSRLALREKGMRPTHSRGDFALGQAGFLTSRGELFEKSVVQSLMGRRSSLARNPSLRLLFFLHLPSVVNA
jgi:hypothetical protein